VREVELLGSKERSGSESPPKAPAHASAPQGGGAFDDDIPFMPAEYRSVA
jgi:hypothetical protein